MPVRYLSGDPLLTRAQVIAFGYNAKGRTEVGPLETALLTRFPAAFSSYRKRSSARRIHPGSSWLWRDTSPMLLFLVVRDSSVGATRARYVQSALVGLARDYRLDGIRSVALARLGSELEWPVFKPIIDYWLGGSALPVYVYETILPGAQADESL